MKKSLLFSFVFFVIFQVNGAESEWRSKVVLRALDGSEIVTNTNIVGACMNSQYMAGLFGSNWKGHGTEQRQDGSVVVSIPLANKEQLSLVKDLLGDASQPVQEYVNSIKKYATENNGGNIYDAACLAGLLGLHGVEAVIVDYFKKNPRQTIVLKEGLDREQTWTQEQQCGLRHIDSLLREESAFKRTIFVTMAGHKNIEGEFYLWETADDVIQQASLIFGNQILNMTARAKTGHGINYSFSSAIGYLMDQKQIEQNNGEPTYIRFEKPTPVAYGPPMAYSGYNSCWGDMWCP